MKISLLTDAPKHNLALMKISTWHKYQGHEVKLNMPLWDADLTYGSWLFEKTTKYRCDVEGGPGLDPSISLSPEIESMVPDYELFNLDYSLGYTWAGCPRKCLFCKVSQMGWTENCVHRSIWDFHDTRFKKICLLNNNTFFDPHWRETFEEIWDADLTVIDENGYDLRLLDEERASVLKRTRFEGRIHFAWDLMRDEDRIMGGLRIAKEFSLRAIVYVLVGFNSSLDDDLYRCQKIHEAGLDPFVMVYRAAPHLLALRRMVNRTRIYRKYNSIFEAWNNYR